MDFSQPYRVITPTLEGPVLRALGGVETALTRSQIVDLVNDVSEAGVRKALARLVDQGIVIEERIGNRYTYQANRDHLMWPSVEGLFRARQLLRERVLQLTSQWDLPPVSVELFGSVADGTADAASDLDILVVCPELRAAEEEIWERQVDRLHDGVVRWTGNSCDIVVLDPTELESALERDEPILRAPVTNLAGLQLRKVVADLLPVVNAALTRPFRDAALSSALNLRLGEISRALAMGDAAATIVNNLNLIPDMSRLIGPEVRKALREIKPFDPDAMRTISSAAQSVQTGQDG